MNYNLPLVTVVTVVFNGEHTLPQTIKSIRKQTYRRIEFIIIDGNSTDNTCDIIKNNQDIIDFWLSEDDKGIYDAMNKGIQRANGDYLWFINAGDEIYRENTLEMIVLNTPLSDIFYGETMIKDTNGNEIGLRRLRPGDNLTWKSLRKGMVVSHQSVIVRKEIAPYYDLKYQYSADYDWLIKVLREANSIQDTGMILTNFLDGGRTKQTIIPGLFERFKIMGKNFGFVPSFFYHIPIGIKFLLFWIRYKRF